MLLLDVGNSRCKWALLQDTTWVRQGVVDVSELVTLQHMFASLSAPSRILISNVAGSSIEQCLRTICAQWDCPIEFIIATAENCGVRNGYDIPQQLGSDRWLALIAAWNLTLGACLVVNCGTATTVDALTARGEFVGGLILPGVNMMQHSLEANTALINAEHGKLREFPCNTADAIYSGILRATIGAIAQQFSLLVATEEKVRCVLSGGAAHLVQPHLAMDSERIDDLVLQGLKIMGVNEA